ncbi:MAG: hypothetical protein IPI88_05210 [Chitinophagaceae bacterium]|nr:hypothetical protein [Chitinophagaceae bacterium]
MPKVSPVIALVKIPGPEPSVVWLPVTCGFAVVDQQTPRAVTGVPPSAVTLPPAVAVVAVMAVIAEVRTVGVTR